MKKAFTMLELVVVIVVIGIIAAAALPRINDDHIAEAADQVMSHIRYTQHLAMQDSKVGDGDKWYKKRWSIGFTEAKVCGDAKGNWKYTIYFDDSEKGNPNSAKEVAKDPQNPSKFLSAGWSGGDTYCDRVSSKFNLTKKFGIVAGNDGIKLGEECGKNGLQTISFDEFGRPMQSVSTTGGGGAKSGYDRLIHGDESCTITLKTAKKQAVITVSPETGYLQVAYSDR